MSAQKVVSREEWLAARLDLMEREKALTRQRDEVSRARRALPKVKIDKEYMFEGEKGRKRCPSCSTGAAS